MSEEKPVSADKSEPKKGSSALMTIVLPAVLAGAAAFGGTKLSSAHAAHAAEPAKAEAKPPGPTAQLDPFLVSINDASKHPHAMKVTLAIEFDEHVKEEAPKSFIPRARDAALTYLRTLSFEEASDLEKTDKMRQELATKMKEAGVMNLERLLITDLVIQ